mmetsp:Transcript_19682/g.61933  ORF Transcript_19682/g.61933 Transcript_19682/m.61933 type:complete len:115 (-) Transcript_19682:2833-3177(-)
MRANKASGWQVVCQALHDGDFSLVCRSGYVFAPAVENFAAPDRNGPLTDNSRLRKSHLQGELTQQDVANVSEQAWPIGNVDREKQHEVRSGLVRYCDHAGRGKGLMDWSNYLTG